MALPPAIVLRSRQTSQKGGRFGFNLTAGQSNEGTLVEEWKGCAPQLRKTGQSKLAPAADLQRFLLVNLSVAGVLL